LGACGTFRIGLRWNRFAQLRDVMLGHRKMKKLDIETLKQAYQD
jgi:hypothetical protein